MRQLYGVFAALTIVFFVTASNQAFAQNTYDDVYTILSTKCQGSGCHGGGASVASGLDFTQPKADVYTLIINKIPVNPAAANKNNRIVSPGYPHRSFLLRKIANCIEPELALEQSEGLSMPQGRPALTNQEIELVRQWIIYAAPQSGKVADTALINAVYNGAGMPKLPVPAPPQDCEGFQVHLGPIFLEPGQEDEYFKRFDLLLPDSIEVNRLELFMNDESHHYILRKFQPGTAQSWPQGLTLLNPLTAFDSDKDYIMAWQDNGDIPLPNGTAYRWAPNTSLDLNYHVKNYNALPMAVDAYVNIYTQPKGTAQKEMKSALINELIFNITPGDTVVKTYNTGIGGNASIWTITSHTHKYGIDYDVYLKKPNGQKGDQIFEGFYNTEYTFNQGYYDWEHPPTRWMQPFLYMGDTMSNGQVPNGLIHEAKYYNYGSAPVNFGFTTNDEMMIIYVQYVDGRYNIPSQGWVDTSCVRLPYVNPCVIDTIIDSTGLAIGDSISIWGGNSTVLGANDTVEVVVGDTVTITYGGETITVVITGPGGPFDLNVGDVISQNQSGTVFLNGTAIGVLYTTGIDEMTLLDRFSIFPNPFHGQTQIQYFLKRGANVSLDIFDLMGKKVASLATDDQQLSGGHAYLFNPENAANGMYLVRLTVDGVSTVKKISVY